MRNSKRRRKGELIPITYDELLSDSSMRGLISFLDVKPGDSGTNPASSGAPSSGAPELSFSDTAAGTGAAATRVSDVIPFPGLVPPAPASARAKNIGAPNVGAPNLDETAADDFTLAPPDIVYRRPQEIREARQAQDGHTTGEQRLYEALWRVSRPIAGHARAVTIGERTLAGLANMSYSAVQDNARSLTRKLAIEVRAPASKSAPKTYIVFSYEEVLKRRRAAGLTHYVRRTSAVEFVDPPSFGAPNLSAPELHGDIEAAAPQANSGAPNSGAPKLPMDGEPQAREFPHEVLAALRKTVFRADDDAALRIMAECRKIAEDVTTAEVAELILQEGPGIARNKNIQNPIGVLIRHIPRCCGEALKQMRAEKASVEAKSADRVKREREEARRIAKLTLEDPSATPDEKAWALSVLSEQNA